MSRRIMCVFDDGLDGGVEFLAAAVGFENDGGRHGFPFTSSMSFDFPGSNTRITRTFRTPFRAALRASF